MDLLCFSAASCELQWPGNSISNLSSLCFAGMLLCFMPLLVATVFGCLLLGCFRLLLAAAAVRCCCLLLSARLLAAAGCCLLLSACLLGCCWLLAAAGCCCCSQEQPRAQQPSAWLCNLCLFYLLIEPCDVAVCYGLADVYFITVN